jgi:PST family polysaccharide transporter
VLAAAAPVLVPVLFGHQWEGTIGTMQVLCLLGVIQVATYLDRPLFLAVRRPDVDLWLTAAGSALDVVGIVIAVHWGVLAVASVLACRAVLFFPVRMFVRQRVTGVLAWPYLGSFMTTLTAAGAAAIGVVSINEFLARAPGPLLLIGDVAVATAAYSLILLKVNPCLANEIGRLVLQVARPTSSRPRLAATGPSLRPEGEGP